MADEKIVIGQPAQPVVIEPEIANLANKLAEKKPFKMEGVVTNEFGSETDDDAPSEKVVIQEKSEIDAPEQVKPPQAKKGTEVKKEEGEAPASTITAEQINAARKLEGKEPLEVEQPADQSVIETPAPAKVPVAEIPKDVTEKLSALEAEKRTIIAERDAARRIADNPLVKKVLEVAGEDGDIRKLVSQFDLTDYDSLSDEQIFELELKSKGLDEAGFDEAMDEFRNQTAYKKKNEIKNIREAFKASADEKNKTFLSASSKTPEQVKYDQDQQQKAVSSLIELTKTLADKGYYGIFVPTADDIETVRDYALNNPVVVNQDGKQSYDMGKTVENALWANPSLRSKFLSAFGDIKVQEGYEKKIKERTRVSMQDFVPGNHSNQKQTFSDAIKAQKIVTPVEN